MEALGIRWVVGVDQGRVVHRFLRAAGLQGDTQVLSHVVVYFPYRQLDARAAGIASSHQSHSAFSFQIIAGIAA